MLQAPPRCTLCRDSTPVRGRAVHAVMGRTWCIHSPADVVSLASLGYRKAYARSCGSFVWMLFAIPLGRYLGGIWPGSVVTPCLTFCGADEIFPKWLHQFPTPPATFSQSLLPSTLLLITPITCEVVSHYGFSKQTLFVRVLLGL